MASSHGRQGNEAPSFGKTKPIDRPMRDGSGIKEPFPGEPLVVPFSGSGSAWPMAQKCCYGKRWGDKAGNKD